MGAPAIDTTPSQQPVSTKRANLVKVKPTVVAKPKPSKPESYDFVGIAG